MDAMLNEIQRKSGQSIAEFSRECPHLSDLMESDRFDLAFFRLRRELKANEHELSWILRQCFTRSTTLQSKLTLLNVFHGAYQRDVVQRALVSEEQSIIRSLEEEFRLVSSLIDEGQTNVNDSHWPPIARQLLSLHGYRQRISHLFEQFLFLCPKLLQGEQGWEIKQTYQITTDKIKKYSSTLSSLIDMMSDLDEKKIFIINWRYSRPVKSLIYYFNPSSYVEFRRESEKGKD